MAKFSYTAVDARGKQTNGSVEANDQNEAIAQIRQLGFYPQRLDEVKSQAAEKAEKKPAVKKKNGKVKMIPGEEAFARLKAKSEARRKARK